MRTPALLFALLLLAPPAWAQTADPGDSSQEDPEGEEPGGEDPEGEEPGSGEPDEPEAAAAPTVDPAELDALKAQVQALQDALSAASEQLGKLDQQVNPPPPRFVIPKLEFDVGGFTSGELRVRLQDKSTGPWYDRFEMPVGISRLENINKLRAEAKLGKFRTFVDLDFVISGQDPLRNNAANSAANLPGLSNYSLLTNVRFEPHSAYIEATDLLVKGLDVRIGQQLVQWGVGDQFNPTNTLNPEDLEDPLLFGTQQGNLMFKVDYTLLNAVTFSGVLIPIFKPALTPSSGQIAVGAVDRLPYVDEDFRYLVHASNGLATATGTPTIVDEIRVDQPDLSPQNMSFAFRVAANLGLQDLALSYHYGRTDVPVPSLNVNTIVDEEMCENDPDAPARRALDENGDPIYGEDEECYGGRVSTFVALMYPRAHTIGFNAAGEIPGIQVGYRFELAVTIPEATTGRIFKPIVGLDPTPAGEFDYDWDGVAGGPQPHTLLGRTFAKWSLGFDRSIGPNVLMNLMWVHGFPNEFGAGDWMFPGQVVRTGGLDPILQENVDQPGGVFIEDQGFPSLFACATEGPDVARQCVREITRPRLADYVVFGLDVNFARQRGLIRLFTIWEASGYTESWYDPDAGERTSQWYSLFTPNGFSAVIYPMFRWNFGSGLEVEAGAMLQLGKTHTLFGDPASGGSQAFFKARYSF